MKISVSLSIGITLVTERSHIESRVGLGNVRYTSPNSCSLPELSVCGCIRQICIVELT